MIIKNIGSSESEITMDISKETLYEALNISADININIQNYIVDAVKEYNNKWLMREIEADTTHEQP